MVPSGRDLDDLSFTILRAFFDKGGEASLADIHATFEGIASAQRVRRRISVLELKGCLIRQARSDYALSFLGRELFFIELGYREPDSTLLQKKRERGAVVVEVEIEALEEGGFLAVGNGIQGCMAEGFTIAEALANLEDVAATLLQLRREGGLSMPQELESYRQDRPLTAELVMTLPE